jgi:hypothetical protein
LRCTPNGTGRAKDIGAGQLVMGLLSDASAIPKIPGTVGLFLHQIGLAGLVFLKHGAEQMLPS